MVVDIDVFSVEFSVVTQHFFADQKNSSRSKIIEKALQKTFTLQWSDELQGIVEDNGSGTCMVKAGDIFE
jgi:hypothetical protein